MNTNGMELIKRLRVLRIKRGWTQAQCAERLGAGYHALRAWERGQRQPNHLGQVAIGQFLKRFR